MKQRTTAYELGFETGLQGDGIGMNPHEVDSDEYDDWNAGWTDATQIESDYTASDELFDELMAAPDSR